MDLKYCSKCSTTKTVDKFSLKLKSKDGYASICKECHNKYRKEYYIKNKKKELKKVKEYQLKKRVNKKSGRLYESDCRLEGCENKANLSKKDIKTGVKRYCSRECSAKGSRSHPLNLYFKRLKANAFKRKITFNLTKDFLKKLLIEQDNKCAITNVPIELSHVKDSSGLDVASLDRIDSSEGYEEGNVQWVMLGINYMKLNRPQKELERVIELIIKNYTGTTS